MVESNKKQNGVWNTLEPLIVDYVGKYAWIPLIIGPIIFLIYATWAVSIVAGFGVPGATASLVYWIIGSIIDILFALFWVKPKFSKRCNSREWDALLDDVLVLGNYRIPWMLVIGVILEFFTQGWIGLFVLGPAIVIIFFGPRQPYKWTTL